MLHRFRTDPLAAGGGIARRFAVGRMVHDADVFGAERFLFLLVDQFGLEQLLSVPARRKKNGVSRANAIERIRSINTRSCRNTPATTSPAM